MNDNKPSFTPLKDIITALLGENGNLPFNPQDALIWKVWDEIVGNPISRNAQPLWIKEGRLRVKVSDPIWLQELNFVEGTIREKLNARLGRRAVDRIEFRLTSK